jgi:hypothetical protein
VSDSIQTKVPLQYNIPVRIRVSSKQSNFFFGSNRNKPKLNLFRLFLGLFREKHFFRFVSVFRTGIETTQTNRTLTKQTKTKQKNLKKNVFYQGVLDTIIFFSRFGPKLNLFWLFFGLFFLQTKKFFSVCFCVSDRYQNNRNKQKLWYGELKRLIF